MTLYPPLWAQNTKYPAAYDRLLFSALLDGGVFSTADLKVGPRGGGAGMSVDVAAGRCIIPGPSGNYVCVSDAIVNKTVASAPGTNTTRVDLVCATVTDNQATGVGDPAVAATWDIQVITGTPAASNPQVPALPANSIPLARLVVSPTDVSIVAGNVREARGNANRAAMGVLGTVTNSQNWTVGSSGFDPVPGTTTSVTVIGHRWVEMVWGAEVQGNVAGALMDAIGQVNNAGTWTSIPGSYFQHRAQVAGGAGAETSHCAGLAVLDPGVYSMRAATRMIVGGQSTVMAGVLCTWFDRGAAPTTTPPLIPSP